MVRLKRLSRTIVISKVKRTVCFFEKNGMNNVKDAGAKWIRSIRCTRTPVGVLKTRINI